MRHMVALLLAGIGGAGPWLEACAPAPRQGESVSVTSEDALIVWEPAARREHFIRRADFQATGASDFGFLVPTSGRPELADADDGVFARLRVAIAPEQRVEHHWLVRPTALVLLPFLFLSGRVGTAPPSPWPSPPVLGAVPPVQVLERKRVAGFDAVVLQATDTQALARWLKSHGYAWRPALAAWIAPYIERRFTISAFKIAASAPGAHLRTRALRMTFETDAPFFPYREPDDTPSRNGVFSAFVFAPGRVEPRLGDDAGHAEPSWTAKTPYSRPIPNAAALLAGVLPGDPGAGLWLTSFEDRARKRVGADLWFTPSANKAEIVPPPIVTHNYSGIPLPLDVLAGFVLLGPWLLWRRRRRARV